MGFDLSGLNPKIDGVSTHISNISNLTSEEWSTICKKNVGVYFRANCSYWTPIWNIVENYCYPDILNNEDIEGGKANGDHMITEKKALAIAECLEEKILTGELMNFIEDIKEYLKNLPDECCWLCNGTGVRENIMDKYRLFDEEPCLLDENQPEGSMFTCNSCNGSGQVRPDCTYDVYDIQVINKFIRFCKNSGGFEIS